MPSSRGFPDTEIKPGSPALQVDSLLFEPPGGKGPRNSSFLSQPWVPGRSFTS